MKLLFSKENSSIDYYVHINSLNLADILCDDMEADHILVDNFLNQFTYNSFGQALNKIVSKLKIGGEIIINEYDIDFLCHSLSTGKIDQQEFNEIVFSGGPANCLFKTETVVDLLEQNGLKITEKYIDVGNLCIIKAVR